MVDITRGKRRTPQGVIIYGGEGIGKTTVAANADNPVFILTEDGADHIGPDRTDVCETAGQFFEYLTQIIQSVRDGESDWKTLVIDSIDWLEDLIVQHVCKEHGVSTPAEIAYGKTWVYALEKWEKILGSLNLAKAIGMDVVLIAHARITRFNDPTTESYDRFTLDLNDKASQRLLQWADQVFLATTEVITKQEDQGFNRRKTKAITTERRVLKTVGQPAFVAKNRLGLTQDLPLDWQAYHQAVEDYYRG